MCSTSQPVLATGRGAFVHLHCAYRLVLRVFITLFLSGTALASSVDIYEYSSKVWLQSIPENTRHQVLQAGSEWCLVLLTEPTVKVWLSEQYLIRFEDRIIVDANALNARLGPNLNAAILTQLGRGTTGQYLSEQDGFVQVLLNQELTVAMQPANPWCFEDPVEAVIASEPAAPNPATTPVEPVLENPPTAAEASIEPDVVSARENTTSAVVPDEESVALYSVTMEGRKKPLSSGTRVLMVGENLFLPTTLLRSAAISVPEEIGTRKNNDVYFVPLDSLKDVSYAIDSAAQNVHLTVESSGFTLFQVAKNERRINQNVAAENMSAVFMDYRLSASGGTDDETLGVLLKPGITFPRSSLVAQFLDIDVSDDRSPLRLETTWIKDFQDQRLRLLVGDAVSTRARGSADLGASYRFGGIQLGTDFSLNPNEITYPLPAIFGEAATQSSVELYINDSLRFRGDTRPGPFVLEQPPLVNGSGNMQLVVRDLLGRESIVEKPFYVNTRLLDPGLADWQLNIGALRDNFGLQSNDYGDAFAAFRYRRGITDYITAQGSLEVSEAQNLFGASSSVLLPKIGLLSLGAQQSEVKGERGKRINFALQNNLKRFNYTLRGFKADAEFRNLSNSNNRNLAEKELIMAVGARLSRGFHASLTHTRRNAFDGTDVDISQLLLTRGLGDFGRITVSAGLIQGNEYRQVESEPTLGEFEDYTVNLIYSYSLNNRRSLTLSHEYGRDTGEEKLRSNRSTVSFRRSRPLDLGTGYSATVRYEDSFIRQFADATFNVQSNAPYGQMQAGIRIGEDSNYSYFGDFEGSLLWTQGSLLGQRPLREGFAVVSLADSPGVTVYRDNRANTVTNSKGLAVVTGLQPYTKNRISIRDYELPINASIQSLRSNLVPRYLGAVEENFGLRFVKNQWVQLLNAQYEPIKVGARVSNQTSGETARIAYNGETFLRNLSDSQRFIVETGQEKCEFDFELSEYIPNEKVVLQCL